MIDFAGEIYARQEGQSILLGTYEQDNRPWSPQRDAVGLRLPAARPRPRPHRPRARARLRALPAVGRAGIQKFVNGPFTFSPDGNPLVGPIRGMRGMWVACAVMAGLSQGGGVGLSLANWMVDGDPERRHLGRWTSPATATAPRSPYTNAKVRENYSRRFRITFPNEELPAARPLHTTPIYDRLTAAQRGVGRRRSGSSTRCGSRSPGKEPIEDVTFHRSQRVRPRGRGVAAPSASGSA